MVSRHLGPKCWHEVSGLPPGHHRGPLKETATKKNASFPPIIHRGHQHTFSMK